MKKLLLIALAIGFSMNLSAVDPKAARSGLDVLAAAIESLKDKSDAELGVMTGKGFGCELINELLLATPGLFEVITKIDPSNKKKYTAAKAALATAITLSDVC